MARTKKTTSGIDSPGNGPSRGNTRRFKRKSSGEKANWEYADAELLRLAVALVAEAGGALRLGYTSDGGAYAIGVYGDGEPYTEYVRPGESIDEFLRELVAYAK